MLNTSPRSLFSVSNEVASFKSGHHMSHVMRETADFICEDKGAAKLCGNRAAD